MSTSRQTASRFALLFLLFFAIKKFLYCFFLFKKKKTSKQHKHSREAQEREGRGGKKKFSTFRIDGDATGDDGGSRSARQHARVPLIWQLAAVPIHFHPD